MGSHKKSDRDSTLKQGLPGSTVSTAATGELTLHIEKSELFETFINASNDLCLIFDPDLRVLYLNEKALGYAAPLSRDQIIGTHLEELVPTVTETGIKDAYLRVLETGEPYYADTIETVPVGRRYFSVRAFLFQKYLAVVSSDITSTRERELVDLNYYKGINQYIAHTIDPYITLTIEGKITQANPAFCAIVGLDESSLVNTDFLDYVLPEDRLNFEQQFNTQHHSNEILGCDCRLPDNQGRLRWITWNFNLFHVIQRNLP